MALTKKTIPVQFGALSEPKRGKYSLPVTVGLAHLSHEEAHKLACHAMLAVKLKVDGLSAGDAKGQTSFVQDNMEIGTTARVKRYSVGSENIRFTLKLDAEELDPRQLHAFTTMYGELELVRTGTIE